VTSRPPGSARQYPQSQAPPPTGLLIFDGDCAFCTSTANWLGRRLRADVSEVPWQRTDLAAHGTTPDRAQREVLWIDRSGVRGGAPAVAAALRACRSRAWRAVGVALELPPLRWIAPSAYRLIARNRQRLPGGTPACALKPSSDRSRESP
jgi:predicted DCC family thiol-disulfide oxidoreductase YuxK